MNNRRATLAFAIAGLAVLPVLSGCSAPQPACTPGDRDMLALLTSCEASAYYEDLSNEIGVVLLSEEIRERLEDGQPIALGNFVGAGALGANCVLLLEFPQSYGEGESTGDVFAVTVLERFDDNVPLFVESASPAEIAEIVRNYPAECA